MMRRNTRNRTSENSRQNNKRGGRRGESHNASQQPQDEPFRNMKSFHLALEIMQQYQAAEKSRIAESCNKNVGDENNINNIHKDNIKTIEDLHLSIQDQIKDKKICRKMGFARLKELTTKDPSEVLLTLNIPNNGFKELLNENSIGKDMMANILTVLAIATKARELRNLASLINTVVTESPFIRQHLQRYMVSLKLFGVIEFNQIDILTNVIVFLLKFQEIQPVTSSEVLSFVLPVLNDTLDRLQKKGFGLPLSIQNKIESLHEKKENIIQLYDEKTRQRISTNEKLHAEKPPEDYQTIPIFPTREDFANMRPFLRPNIVEGNYLDTSHYLDVQFRLLREDYIRPLRESVESYRNSLDTSEKKLKKIGVYKNIHILCPYNTEGGLVHLISFDVKPFSHIHWEVSKRLLPGSLLCLSSDNFETMKVATVARREPSELKKGKLEIHFEQLDDEIFSISPSTTFVMVESEAYFEAFRHTLRALQQITEYELPLKEYIVHVEKEVKIPRYLNVDSLYSFTSTFPGVSTKYAVVPILNTRYWPSHEELTLDHSQFSALKAALTKEFVVIQGPPGTGKTFIGLKITQMLLENPEIWNKENRTPILVVCYTNHALDQFLEGILTFTKDVVRIGGRCSNDEVKEFKLSELRQKARKNREVPHYVYLQKRDVLQYIEAIESYLEIYTCAVEKSTQEILPVDILQSFMGKRHVQFLQKGPVGNLHQHSVYTIADWLCIPHPSYLKNSELSDDEEEIDETTTVCDEEADDIDFELSLREIDEDEYKHTNKRKYNGRCMAGTSLGYANNGWIKVNSSASNRKMKQYIRQKLKSQEIMIHSEAKQIGNLWRLEINKRWSLYRLWVARYVARLLQLISDLQKHYHEHSEKLKELRSAEDKYLLRKAKVIGMTTTGAGKYREFLQDLQPRIVIVEEAAEVLEAHIVTSLAENTQHLILIGDHQQLRPSPTVYELVVRYSLDISLFERMIKNGMSCHQLALQHRMRPCIARLLTPHIYPNLENHSSVERYENILGVGTNVFFVNHCKHESSIVDTKSHSNLHEAAFLVQLCKFLRYQGYEASQLTVLTTYSGQLFALKQLMKGEKILEGIRVTVVDNYQGEENDIILISFVRSNDEGSIGFLKVSNRVCVALSRAKKGLYCIGNFELLAEESRLWKNIIKELQQQNAIGLSLPLHCQNHPEIVSHVSKAEDFTKNVPDGGCTKPCNLRMECGHMCIKRCHPYDRDHTEIKCLKRCTKILCSLGHVCPKRCFEECGNCTVPVEKVVPKCNHITRVPCHMDPSEFKCSEICENRLECGHICNKLCHQPCNPCTKMIMKIFKCKHCVNIPCHKANDTDVCPESCKKILACGHTCTKTCGIKPCPPCETGVEKLLSCKHKIEVKCADYSSSAILCERACPRTMECKHECKLNCGHIGDCGPCEEPCNRILSCKHLCSLKCSDRCPKECDVCVKYSSLVSQSIREEDYYLIDDEDEDFSDLFLSDLDISTDSD